jgi:hypothetical protein
MLPTSTEKSADAPHPNDRPAIEKIHGTVGRVIMGPMN